MRMLNIGHMTSIDQSHMGFNVQRFIKYQSNFIVASKNKERMNILLRVGQAMKQIIQRCIFI